MFTFTSSPTQLHIFDTAANPLGLCSLSPSCDNSLLAMPATRPGRLHLVDLISADSPPLDIAAHDSALSVIQINVQGTRVATASTKAVCSNIGDQNSDRNRKGFSQSY